MSKREKKKKRKKKEGDRREGERGRRVLWWKGKNTEVGIPLKVKACCYSVEAVTVLHYSVRGPFRPRTAAAGAKGLHKSSREEDFRL